MSRGQSPDTSFQLDEGTALQRLQNGLELGLSISKPTASARSAEILDAIDQMELKFPMLTSEGAEGRVETLINAILHSNSARWISEPALLRHPRALAAQQLHHAPQQLPGGDQLLLGWNS